MKYYYSKLFSVLAFFFLVISFQAVSQVSTGEPPYSWSDNKSDFEPVQSIRLPDFDVEALRAEDELIDQQKDVPLRFAYLHEGNVDLTNAGTWHTLPNGARLLRIEFESEDAYSMNFTFSQFHLPEGSKLWAYSSDGNMYRGAFTSENNSDSGVLALGIVSGDKVTIEYLEPQNLTEQPLLVLSHVAHDYRNIYELARGFDDSGNCNNNVVCPEGDPWSDQISSVAMITTQFGSRLCTGALVNNVNEDGTPYFLTADHCLGSGVTSWVFYFNYDSPTCSPSSDGPLSQSISGCVLRANNGGSDFALLELNITPPASFNIFYSGWDRSGDFPTSQVGIHHPRGDVKKITFDQDPASQANWGGAATWRIATWEDGTTEPGSSGSPLYDQNQRIIGQLYGGTASCSNNIDDYYGRFDVSWDGPDATSRLRDWLDPGNSIVAIDGYDPNAPTVSIDAGITDVEEPEGSICGDAFLPVVQLRNYGSDVLSSVEIVYSITGGPNQTYSWSGNLASSADEGVVLPTISGLAAGAYTFSVSTQNPNGQADQNPANDNASSSFDIIPDGQPITLELLTDNYPGETTWQIANDLNEVVFSGGPYSGQQTLYTIEMCLPEGCYTFSIFDSFGDGLQYQGVVGDYTLTDDENNVLAEMVSGGDFGEQADHTFCITIEPVTCGPGEYNNDGTCTVCPPGTYCPGDGNSYPCTAGTSQPQSGQISCNSCEPGTFSSTEGSVSCNDCPSGTYQDSAGSTECLNCAEGSVSDPGATVCIPCSAGTYELNGECVQCPPGTYCPGDGNSYPCAAGTYQGLSGQTSCNDCDAGTFSSIVGAESCQACPPGTFQSVTGASECLSCAAGTSQSEPGQISCDACLEGTYSSTEGAISCENCPAGTANSQTGQTQCSDCPPGSFSDIDGSTECSLCPSDTYSNTSGSTECIDCPTGSSSDPGAVSCVSCDFDVTGSTEPATLGFANGTATVIASGGQEPYTYQWNDPFMQTTATAVGLFPGSYTCIVTDANDCEEEFVANITVFDVLTGITEINPTYCNTGGYELSDFIAANQVSGATAYRWQFTPQGGSALPVYTRYAANQWIRLQWVSGIALGTTYDVRVKVSVNGEWGEYGDVCTISTSADVPLTEVLPNYTPTNSNGESYALCDFALAYNITNATNFRWRFDPDQDPENGNEIYYTRGTGSSSIRLSWVNDLQPGTTYYVAVQVRVSDTWGAYGNVHPLNLATVSDQVTVRPDYCNQTYGPTGYLLATTVCEATYYRFRFIPQVSGAIRQKTSGNYALNLGSINPPLSPGTYNVEVRVNQNGVLGSYGPSCPITISGPELNEGEVRSEQLSASQAGVKLYPNPNDGNAIWVEIDGLSGDESQSLSVQLYNAHGLEVVNRSLSFDGTEHISQYQLAFDDKLAPGIYFLRISLSKNQNMVERIVIY